MYISPGLDTKQTFVQYQFLVPVSRPYGMIAFGAHKEEPLNGQQNFARRIVRFVLHSTVHDLEFEAYLSTVTNFSTKTIVLGPCCKL